MDMHFIAFSVPRDATSTSHKHTEASETSGSVLPPDARAVGSRPGVAMPIPLSLAPGSQRPSASTSTPSVELTDTTSDPFGVSSALSTPSSSLGPRQAAYSSAVHNACAHAMSIHGCVIHATSTVPSLNGDTDGVTSNPAVRITPVSASPKSTQSPKAPLSLGTSAASPDTLLQPSPTPILDPALPRFSISMCGTETQVNDARGLLIQTLPFTWRLEIFLESSDIMQPGRDVVQPAIRSRLDQIMQESGTLLQIEPVDAASADGKPATDTQSQVSLVFSGGIEPIEYARVQVLVMLDELNDLYIDTIDMDSKTLHVNAGRKRSTIQSIERESGANIYIPSPFFGVLQSTVPPKVQERRHTVYVTGPPQAVSRAREMLQSLSKKSRNQVKRQVTLMPRKVDWLLLERLEALREVMLDNSTFLELPLIGSQRGQVTVCLLYTSPSPRD